MTAEVGLVAWQDRARFYHRLRDSTPTRPYRAKCVGLLLPWVGTPKRSKREPCPRCFGESA